jgi:intron-binding protein aquarius
MTSASNSFQNSGEAEYVVALYQFMRLLGYPADQITILTTYQGQRQLISDIIAQRCKKAIFGESVRVCFHSSSISSGPPNQVATVDSFQGQHSDYILLSLVRTTSIGYLQDIRRLIAALSRARLGLYVFCRKELFVNSPQLVPIFQQLSSSPSQLQLVNHEAWPPQHLLDEPVSANKVFEVSDVTSMGLKVYEMTVEATKKASR